MTRETLTRRDTVRLLSMIREDAVEAGDAERWRVVQDARLALIGERERARLAGFDATTLTNALGKPPRRWKVDTDEIVEAANTALAAA